MKRASKELEGGLRRASRGLRGFKGLQSLLSSCRPAGGTLQVSLKGSWKVMVGSSPHQLRDLQVVLCGFCLSCPLPTKTQFESTMCSIITFMLFRPISGPSL